MQTPLLTTKFFLPTPQTNLITRPRLINKLNTGLTGKLTLVSAPAGFGKTTLLSEWVQSTQQPVAWLSLDDGDNDLPRFLNYFIGALQTIEPQVGLGVSAALLSPGPTDFDFLLTDLLNEISDFSKTIVLILDDYHVIESKPIDRTLIYIIEHLPPQLHLVIASRIDPSLPLARLRARTQMNEIRAHALRFNAEETAAFLNSVIDIRLSAQDVAALESRTEGWIAGLQLAALSMQGLQNRGAVLDFIRRLTGSDRYIQDYLTDEVLQQQPQDKLDFLLHTSILNRLSGSLCDAVTQIKNSQAMLESLETTNLFMVPLDNHRRWYRYHHLFRDLLAHRLNRTYPERIPELHQRASIWFEKEKDTVAAIRHAQSAGDKDQVAAILENQWQEIVHQGELTKLKGILDSLGPAYTRPSAPLSMAYCWIYALTEAIDEIPGHIGHIREVIKEIGGTGDGQLPNRLAVIPSLIETIEAIIALDKNQAEKAKTHAQKAIALIPANVSPANRGLLQGAAAYRLSQAHHALGEIEAACEVSLGGLEMLKASKNYLGAAATVLDVASMYQEIDKTLVAISLCEEMLAYVEAHQWNNLRPIGLVYVKYADLLADVGDFSSAQRNFKTGRDLLRTIKTRHSASLVEQVEKKLAKAASPTQPLIEPLSPRELEVIQLLATGLSNRAIGERLFLALDTVKGHNRNIYGKLGVKNRTQAVSKAIALKLVPHQLSK